MSDLVGTTKDVAERLEVDEQFVRDLIKDRKIPHVRLGPRKVVIPWAALEEWLLAEARASTPPGGTRGPTLGLVADSTD
jgi:excisionase family DNA binding protein